MSNSGTEGRADHGSTHDIIIEIVRSVELVHDVREAYRYCSFSLNHCEREASGDGVDKHKVSIFYEPFQANPRFSQ